MSFIYSQEQGAAYWRVIDSDTQSLEQSNGSHTVNRSYKPDSEMESCHHSLSGQTLKHSTGDLGVDAWILSARASRVSHSQSRENSELMRIQGMNGPPPFESFGKFDQSGYCLRTYQVSLLTSTCTPYSGSWPRAGMIVNGTAYLRTPMAPLTKETGCGSLPTPTAKTYGSNKSASEGSSVRHSLSSMAKHNLWQDSKNQKCGALNPDWVELLMGWPKGWTSIESLSSQTIIDWLDTDNPWSHSWEYGTPRTGKKANNSARLKAIGNGQVPICAIMAWNL